MEKRAPRSSGIRPLALASTLLVAAALLLSPPSPASGTDSPKGPPKAGTEPAPPVAAHRVAWSHLPADEFVLYLPQKYEPCLACHPKELAEEEDFNVDTNWRDTTLGKNLHSLHVYRQPTGVNCTVCHVLEKDGTARYAERVVLKRVEKGGSCSPSCHRPKTYHNAGRFRFLQEKAGK